VRDETPRELAAWRAAYRAGMLAGSASCPGEDELAALAVGELAGEPRAAVADHVASCRRCADGHRLLLDLHAEAGGRSPSRVRTWIAGASVAAALAGALLVWRPAWTPDAPSAAPLRGAAGQGAVEPRPGAVLASAPAVLAWTARPAARGYRARIYDADGDLLWESGAVTAARLALAPEAAAALRPGHEYFWTVDVDGVAPGERLGPFWFQIAGR
jgi:hypothetical protein